MEGLFTYSEIELVILAEVSTLPLYSLRSYILILVLDIRNLCMTKEEELILLLLELCPSIISMRNSLGNTPFHFAALNGCSQVLSRLLSMNPEPIDSVNLLGSTPLHYAAENSHVDCVKVLLSWNCDINIENSSKKTPMEIAEHYRYDKIVSLIRAASAK